MRSEREDPRYEQTPGHEVHRRQRCADLDEVRELVATGSPYEGVRLVPDRRDEGPRRRQEDSHHKRLVAHLCISLKIRRRGRIKKSSEGASREGVDGLSYPLTVS